MGLISNLQISDFFSEQTEHKTSAPYHPVINSQAGADHEAKFAGHIQRTRRVETEAESVLVPIPGDATRHHEVD
jgi:hypothetical protein